MSGTVLLIEDEESIASVVRAYLERDGYRVVWARTGGDGIAELPRHAVRMVVLDIGTVNSFKVATTPPGTVTITNGGGGSENIPFVIQNADVPRVTATFWIETVQRPGGGSFLQLQYTQTVLLNFPVQVTGKPQGPNLSWPHVTVATLVKRFGS